MITAKFNGNITTASEFQHREISDKNLCADDTEYQLICPTTGYKLTHVSESSGGRIPHFRYCPETPKHKRVGQTVEHKTLVRGSVAASEVSRLLTSVEVCNTEIESGGYEAKVSDKESREPDVLLEFEKRDSQLGEGLIIEVQVSNKDKNEALTTADYLSFDRDYSVLWLKDYHFNTEPDMRSEWEIKINKEQKLRNMTYCISDTDPEDMLHKNTAAECEGEVHSNTTTQYETPDNKESMIKKLCNSIRSYPGVSSKRLADKYNWNLLITTGVLYDLKREGEIEMRDETGPAWYYIADK